MTKDNLHAARSPVSKILWHFTGGPIRDASNSELSDQIKSPNAAYDALKSILLTQELRTGSYKEEITAVFPQRLGMRFDPSLPSDIAGPLGTGPRGKWVPFVEKDAKVTQSSVPVVCLADIPISSLDYHSRRYGRFAVGFHRSAAIKHGFYPVCYSLERSANIVRVLDAMELCTNAEAGIENIEYLLSQIGYASGQIPLEGHKAFLQIMTSDAQEESATVAKSVNRALDNIRGIIALFKSFDQSEFETIYCEREWRCDKSMHFTYDAIAMVILPRILENTDYYSKFLSEVGPELPQTIPIIPWEDITEN